MENRKFLQNQAYDYILNIILDNQLEDGKIYSQTQVAAQIGVSRTPMRDALQRLEQEGYIEIIPSKGFQLKPITTDGILNCIQIRNALEGYCAVLLAQNVETDSAQKTLANMRTLLSDQYALFETNYNLTAFSNADIMFHRTIVQYSQNSEMISLFMNHQRYIQRLAEYSLQTAGRVKDTLDEHYHIYTAIKGGNPYDAYQAIMLHTSNTQKISLALLRKQEQTPLPTPL